jgi:hypothetical protein
MVLQVFQSAAHMADSFTGSTTHNQQNADTMDYIIISQLALDSYLAERDHLSPCGTACLRCQATARYDSAGDFEADTSISVGVSPQSWKASSKTTR